MGKLYPELDERLREFIARQSVFFVATAPCLSSDGSGGHVNLSPKGYRDTFAVLGRRSVAYLDLTGSGAETIAHLRQNGQITIMFCSFDHDTKILRLYGTGEVVLPDDARWAELAAHFPRIAPPASPASPASPPSPASPASPGRVSGSERSIILVEIDRIADSCGYAVPVMEVTAERDVLDRWAQKKSAAELSAYRAERNAVSIDGLPALGTAELTPGRQ